MIAVHPDDETLGCGGTLFKHKANGDEIHWVIATDIKESDGFRKESIEKREGEIRKVEKLYGFDSLHRLKLSTMKVDEYSMSELIGKISKVINEVKPNIIYLPFKSDVHSDHRHIFDAAYSCTKSFRYPFVKKIYMIETLSETEFAPSTKEDSFIPNVFVDISKFMHKKIEIVNVFESEIGKHPFPRSVRNIEALATLRGATAGCEYAESFMLLKEII
ncbi:MAG: GlcNAc-PI de-N-acetylase [uncultured Sulfurovum sp.]|uniref:GlcNAc-PI de-N-acetylase n=1 Tax=uncultured Sulfurovum sp. TaxID=269237 RepID=A0A6S6U5H7_9BACT|nr:MAG: GlcNAc-PI de-N-acetylase [uncultured Sulfurovum sp.]